MNPQKQGTPHEPEYIEKHNLSDLSRHELIALVRRQRRELKGERAEHRRICQQLARNYSPDITNFGGVIKFKKAKMALLRKLLAGIGPNDKDILLGIISDYGELPKEQAIEAAHLPLP